MAEAQGAVDLGKGISTAATDVVQTNYRKDIFDANAAHADFTIKKMQLDRQYADGKDANGEPVNYLNQEQSYQRDLGQIQQQSSSNLSQRGQQLLANHLAPVTARAVADQGRQARVDYLNAHLSYVQQVGQQQLTMAVQSDKPEDRLALITQHNQLLDDAVSIGALTNDQRVQAGQKWTAQFATELTNRRLQQAEDSGNVDLATSIKAEIEQAGKDAAAFAAAHPAQAPAAPGSVGTGTKASAASVSQVADNLGIQPRVLAAAISYETGGTFNPSLRGGKGNNYLGLIQFGPEEQKQYGVRPGMTVEQQMPAVEHYLRDRGVKPGMGVPEVYSIINAGSLDANGQPRWNSSDGNGTIRDHVAKIERGHLDSADNFLASSGDKPVQVASNGDLPSAGGPPTSVQGSGSPLEFTTQQNRDTLLNSANNTIRKIGLTNQSDLASASNDDFAEAQRTGNVAKPKTIDDFQHAFGKTQDAANGYRDYTDKLTSASDVFSMGRMSPSEQNDLIAKNAPAQGSGPGFAEQAKRQDQLILVQKHLQTEMKADSASYVLNHSPAVKSAYDDLQKAISTPGTDPAAARVAANDYAFKTLAEQTRLGVPDGDRELLPKSYVAGLAHNLVNSNATGAAPTAIKNVYDAANAWGDNWPRVYAQVKKEAEPLFTVIGSFAQAGATPPPAVQTLAEASKVSNKELIETLPPLTQESIKMSLSMRMVPFLSVLHGPDREKVAADFYSQTLKLAGIYASRGQQSDAAVNTAFNDLIGKNPRYAPDILAATAPKIDTSTPAALKTAVWSGKIERPAAEAIAIKNGWMEAPSTDPVIPMSR